MAAFASMARALCAAVLLPLLVITCDSPTSPTAASALSALQPMDGSAQLVATVTVKLSSSRIPVGGTSFAGARAIDENGTQLPSLFPSSFASSNPAVATVTSFGFVRGVGNGTASISATIDGVTGQAQIVVGTGITPGGTTVSQMAVATQPVGGISGSPLEVQPVVELRDASSQRVAGSTNPVTVSIASGTGTLSGATTVAAVDGVATFSGLRIIGVGTFTLRFTASGLPDVISAALTSMAAPPTELALVTAPSTSVASGAVFGTQPMIGLLDALGSPVRLAGILVTAAISSGGGTLGGTTSVLTDVAGQAIFTNLSISGQTGTRTLVFTAPGLEAVASPPISVIAPAPPDTTEPPPPTGTLLFGSDWSGDTGESTPAVTDGGRWSVIGNTEDRVTVVPATGLGFPSGMENVLRIRHRTSHAVGVYRDRGWPAPAINEHLYYRVYIRMSIAQADPPPLDNSAHPIMARPGTAAFALLQNLGQTFRWTLAINNSPNDNTHRFSFNAQRDAVYRFEFHYHRLTATTARLEVRVYDAGDVLVATGSDMPCTAGHLAAHTLADVGIVVFPSASTFDGLTGMTISHEGANWGPFSDDRVNMNYYGGVAVSRSGWIGPYRQGQR